MPFVCVYIFSVYFKNIYIHIERMPCSIIIDLKWMSPSIYSYCRRHVYPRELMALQHAPSSEDDQ